MKTSSDTADFRVISMKVQMLEPLYFLLTLSYSSLSLIISASIQKKLQLLSSSAYIIFISGGRNSV